MLVSRTEYAPGLGSLGDFLSTQKARSQANRTSAPAASTSSQYGTNASQKFAVTRAQNKVLSLIGQQNALTQYNKDLATGNINPAFAPPPAAVDPATLAAARQAYGATVQKSGTAADKFILRSNNAVMSTMPSATSPGGGGFSLFRPGTFAQKFGAPVAPPSVAATISPLPVAAAPLQQAAAALVAAQPSIAPSSSSGGGGGGGDSSGSDTSSTDGTTTDATMPTGWAALSPQMQMGVVIGGLVVVGGIVYLIRRRR